MDVFGVRSDLRTRSKSTRLVGVFLRVVAHPFSRVPVVHHEIFVKSGCLVKNPCPYKGKECNPDFYLLKYYTMLTEVKSKVGYTPSPRYFYSF